LGGVIFINRNGLRWHHAPKEYGPPKALSNRWQHWSEIDVFARIFEGLAAQATDKTTIMMNATSLKAHRAQLCCQLVSRSPAGQGDQRMYSGPQGAQAPS